jgi:hypothetical protein
MRALKLMFALARLLALIRYVVVCYHTREKLGRSLTLFSVRAVKTAFSPTSYTSIRPKDASQSIIVTTSCIFR